MGYLKWAFVGAVNGLQGIGVEVEGGRADLLILHPIDLSGREW